MAERPARRRKPSKSVEQLKAEISARDEAKAQRAAERKAAKKPLTSAERYEQEKAERAKKGPSGYSFSQYRTTGSGGHGSEYNVPSRLREEFVISYLLDEGFASDEKSAQAIAGAMSEEWKQSIVEVWSSKMPGADALDRAELEKIKTVKTPTGQKVTTNKQYPATLNKEKGMKSYGPSGTEYFTPNIPGTNISDPNRAKFKSVSSGQYERIPADQSSHLRTGVPKVDDSTKYNPSYKPPGMRK